jgi:spectinomycin phosphotransferase
MLEKPDLQDEQIIACLQDEYGLLAVQLAFLPLGADRDTAVYRAIADDGTPYFCKLRRGVFDETSVALSKCLSDQGIVQILPPLVTRRGQLWATLDAFKVILYPYVEGHDAYEGGLSDRQWVDFGTALKRIHTAAVPPALIRRIQRETYSPKWREIVKAFLERVEDQAFDDPVAAKVAALLRARRDQIDDLVGRTEQLARALLSRPLDFILCHSDIHAGNILIDAGGAFYIVDWDAPILAPKERDLMFVGGGQMAAWRTPREEETLFYQGYGQTRVDPTALAYYRYERIIEDIAVFCEQIFLTRKGGRDREQSLQYLASNFVPNGVLEIAYSSDQTSREE